MKVDTRAFLLFMIYSLVVTFTIAFTTSDYSYWDISLVPYVLSFYFFGIVIIFDYIKNNTIFTFGILFNLFGALYTNFYIAESIFSNAMIDSAVISSMMLSYIAILSFDFAYYVMPTIKFVNSYNEGKKCLVMYDYNMLILALTALFIISFMAEFYVIFIKIGLYKFFSVSRASKSLLISKYSLLTFYQSTIPLVSAIALYLTLEYKTKLSKVLFLIATFVAFFNASIRASRAELFSIILPIIFLLHSYKKISNQTVVVLGLVSVFLFGIWKSLYSSQRAISFDSEFNTWYKICKNVLSSKFEYMFGSSYLTTIKNLFVPITHSSTLSHWYLVNFEPEVLARGGGRGFSAVLEAYINFHLIGVFFIYFVYGLMLKTLEICNKKLSDTLLDYKVVLFIIIMSSMYMFFRAESYSLWKNMIWFKIYPTAIIFYISRAKHINVLKD